MAKKCINPKCDCEIPTSATFCSFCGTQQVENENLTEEERMRKEIAEMQNTIQLLTKALADAQQNSDSSEENLQSIDNMKRQLADLQGKNDYLQNSLKNLPPVKEKKSFPTSILIVGLALLLLVGGLVGYFYYYKPYITDRDAPRYYSFANNTFLRSSQEAGVDYNKLGTVPYGSELITYDKGIGWSEVKWINSQTGKSIKGYISSDFILPSDDFKILNSIWGDNESKEIIDTGKCRIALLNYFKNGSYAGSWQVFSKLKNVKPNTTYYDRVVNRSSKFTDFAVIIKNINNSERKCLLFTFDDDETPHLVYEENAPFEGDIARITKNPYYGYTVTYR